MDAHRHAGLGCCGEEAIVVVGEVETAARVLAELHAGHARLGHRALHLGHRMIDANVRHEGDAPQPIGRVGAVLGQPVVVRLDAREVKRRVDRVPKERVRDARRGVEHLGLDAVCILFGEANRRVIAAGAHVFPLAPAVLLLDRHAGVAIGAEVHRVERPLHDPRVALLEALHARCPITELRRQTGGPQVGRLVDVRVAGDQLIVAHVVRPLLSAMP